MNTQQQLYLAASGALDVALAVWMLRPSSGKVTLLRCAAVSVACVLFAVVKLPLAALVTTSLFFAISLAYVGIVVVAPLAASIVLLRAGSAGVTRAAKLLLWSMALVLPLVGVYASFIEPFRLVEERVEVVLPAERAPSEPLRIAVLADIQSRKVDEHLREAVRRALAFEPHLIVLPGDLIQEHPEENYLRVIDEFRALLAPLEAPLGVYFALGNTDTPRLVGRVFEGTNVQLLENQSVEHTFGGRSHRAPASSSSASTSARATSCASSSPTIPTSRSSSTTSPRSTSSSPATRTAAKCDCRSSARRSRSAACRAPSARAVCTSSTVGASTSRAASVVSAAPRRVCAFCARPKCR
jgi:hypothetical protein